MTRTPFGQWLVERGIVTLEQVQLALQLQVVHGGRIGTNLLKRGALEIDTLSAALAERTGLPAARLADFERIDEAALALVSAELAAKHKAYPLALRTRGAKELVVALRDPFDIAAIDEIAFAAGARVKPVIAPELLIYRFIERCYHVRLEMEFTAQHARASLGLADRSRIPEARTDRPQGPSRAAPLLPHPSTWALAPELSTRPEPAQPPPEKDHISLTPAIEFVTFDTRDVGGWNAKPEPARPAPELPRPPMARAPTPPRPTQLPRPAMTRVPTPPRPTRLPPPPVAREVRSTPPPSPGDSMIPANMHAEVQRLKNLHPELWVLAPPTESGITAASLLPPEDQIFELTEQVLDASSDIPIEEAIEATPELEPRSLPVLDREPPKSFSELPSYAVTALEGLEKVLSKRTPDPSDTAADKEPMPEPGTLARALAELARAESRDEVGDALLDLVEPRASAAILFKVRENIALGWRGLGVADPSAIESLTIPLSEPSTLALAAGAKDIWRGVPKDTPHDVHLRALADDEALVEVLVAPVLVKDRVVSLVYLRAAEDEPFPEDLPELLREAAAAAAVALVRLIKKTKT